MIYTVAESWGMASAVLLALVIAYMVLTDYAKESERREENEHRRSFKPLPIPRSPESWRLGIPCRRDDP